MSDNIEAAAEPIQYLAVIHASQEINALLNSCNFGAKKLIYFNNGVELALSWEQKKLNIVGIISQAEILSPSGITLQQP